MYNFCISFIVNVITWKGFSMGLIVFLAFGDQLNNHYC